ncbi:hypothetical protein F5Y05DRAFT_352899 [Hypoxylon sp. FL0543]|nr:hypothetical protein F5Y05DRAFT_352899 [Hypoxylon sp. FL0543]
MMMNRTSSDHASLDVRPSGTGRHQSSSPVPFATFHDPRSSSTQSLVPSPSEQDGSGRRKLLVIYIHGFMGSDASFQSFPAHVHRYLKIALSDTHIIHSKIYPRYKTYKSLDVARDNFSLWLTPHESPTTDVVLVGHSMGGLLAADIALMPSRDQYRMGYFLHRILGTVSLDAPLLGLHPSVITAGLASLFRPKSDTTTREEPIPDDESTEPLAHANSEDTSVYSDPSSTSQLSLPYPRPPRTSGSYGMTFDPTFNPTFVNDARVQDRGWWRNIVHFVEKHNSEGLFDAATNHIMSHLEFGGCLLDSNGLKTRYENIRKLEDVDDLKHRGFPHVPPQVRFVQYYTVCHGYPKKPNHQNSESNPETTGATRSTHSVPSSPQVPAQIDDNVTSPQSPAGILPEDTTDTYSEESSLQLLPPEPMSEEVESASLFNTSGQPLEGVADEGPEKDISSTKTSSDHIDASIDSQQNYHNNMDQKTLRDDGVTTIDLTDAVATLDLDLPAIPELPVKPEPLDLEQYTDKDARRKAEKDAKRVEKDYAKLVKERDKIVKERQKIIDKRKKKLAQEAEKREKEEKKRRKKETAVITGSGSTGSEEQTSQNIPPLSSQESCPDSDFHAASPTPGSSEQSRGKIKPPKQPKERKFCSLPGKVGGQVDSKWVKVFMKDTDQVGAHTGLFFRGEHYERLVGDVGEIIVNWVQDDMTKRAILEME